MSRPSDLSAVVSDHDIDLEVPKFSLDDAPGVADLIEALVLS